jgi:hypothetical protein
MAWTKTWTDPDTGIQASHWEVIGIVYQHQAQLSELKVGCWSSAQAYADGKQPVTTKTYSIPSGLAPSLATGALQFVTGYAMQQPEFEGAEVVTP